MFNQLKIFFSGQRGAGSVPTFNMLRSRKDVYKAVIRARETGRALGIYCPAIAEGMLLVGVAQISTDLTQPVVTFHPYDLNGILLQRNKVALGELRTVCEFNCVYENPLLRKEAAIT